MVDVVQRLRSNFDIAIRGMKAQSRITKDHLTDRPRRPISPGSQSSARRGMVSLFYLVSNPTPIRPIHETGKVVLTIKQIYCWLVCQRACPPTARQ